MGIEQTRAWMSRIMQNPLDIPDLPAQYNSYLPKGFSDLSWHYKDLFLDEVDSVVKHAIHDQTSHGNRLSSRLTRAWASNSLDALFPDGAITTAVPFPQAGRRRTRRDYSLTHVNRALNSPTVLTSIDPRTLSARQPSLTRSGVAYYLTDVYPISGTTFADSASKLNAHPTIYVREDGTNLILSGHHRAAAALIKGEMLQARVIEGPWPLR